MRKNAFRLWPEIKAIRDASASTVSNKPGAEIPLKADADAKDTSLSPPVEGRKPESPK